MVSLKAVPTTIKPLGTEEELYPNRFRVRADAPDASIIMGSTYAPASGDSRNDMVLDAAASNYIFDEHGIKVGFSQAVADGLGHSLDERENQSTANVSLASCLAAVRLTSTNTCNNTEEFRAALYQAGRESLEHRLSHGSANQVYHSLSSLSAVCVRPNGEGKLVARCGNVGDGVVIVIDAATKSIKRILNPRAYPSADPTVIRRMGVQWGPMSVQALADAASSRLQVSELLVEEDDIVIQMTDGAWSELLPFTRYKANEGTSNEYYQYKLELDLTVPNPILENALTNRIFENELNRDLEKAPLSAYAIARNLLKYALDKSVAERKAFLALLQQLQADGKDIFEKNFASRDEYEQYTIQVWLVELAATNDEKKIALANNIKNYLDGMQHDGVSYDIEKYPAQSFAQELQRKNFGDCTSISIMRVPNRKVELVRAWIENPEKRVVILSIILDEFSSADEFSRVVERLKEEYAIVPPKAEHQGVAPAEIRIKNLYPKGVEVAYDSQIKSAQLDAFKRLILDKLNQNADMQDIYRIFSIGRVLVNQHENPRLDRFFKRIDTNSFAKVWEDIIDMSLKLLFRQVDQLSSTAKQIELLDAAKQQPIFCELRSKKKHPLQAIETKLREVTSEKKEAIKVVLIGEVASQVAFRDRVCSDELISTPSIGMRVARFSLNEKDRVNFFIWDPIGGSDLQINALCKSGKTIDDCIVVICDERGLEFYQRKHPGLLVISASSIQGEKNDALKSLYSQYQEHAQSEQQRQVTPS